jgi:hypothetical protein
VWTTCCSRVTLTRTSSCIGLHHARR